MCFNIVYLLNFKYYIVMVLLGGFYFDDIGYVVKSCKKCFNGFFVVFDKVLGI